MRGTILYFALIAYNPALPATSRYQHQSKSVNAPCFAPKAIITMVNKSSAEVKSCCLSIESATHLT